MDSLMLMNFDFKLLGELPYFAGLTLKRSYYEVGSFKLTMKRGMAGADLLERDRLLYFPDAPEKAMLIEKLTLSGENVTADGVPLKGLCKRRIALPPLKAQEGSEYGHFGWDCVTCDAESAYLHYANNNMVAPEDAKRGFPRLVAGENLHRGESFAWQARFDKLEEIFAEIGEVTGLGWDIRPDFAKKQFVFSAWQGTDRTQGASRAVLAERLGNVAQSTLTSDASAAVTTIYAGGAGEDEKRLVLAQGAELDLLARRERFADCGSIDDSDMLRLAARQKLVAEKLTLTAEVAESGLCRYGRDYDVGDLVTLVADGRQTDTRLISMEEVYENGTRNLRATFGDAPVTMTTMLRHERRPVAR